MIADVSVHDSQDGNPHAHILLTLRSFEGGSFGKKCREWNATERLIKWREQYADLTNQYLERYGHDQRIDARSYADQGIDQISTIHLGPHAYRMEQRGIPSDRGDINREIERDNQQIKEIVKKIALLEQERQCLKSMSYGSIEYYKKIEEEPRSAVEALAHRLTERGRDILIQQQRNIENAIQRPQRPISEQEPPAHQNRPSSSRRQFGFDEQQPRLQEKPSHLKRPPPLRRHREERHLALERRNAQERLRQRPQEHQMPDHHALTEQTEWRQERSPPDHDRDR